MEQLRSFLPVLNSHPPVRIEHNQIQISVKEKKKAITKSVQREKQKQFFKGQWAANKT